MSTFGLPHKANIGEIVRVKDYDGYLFLITEWTEEITYTRLGKETDVYYTGRNVDTGDLIMIADEDITSIAVLAKDSEKFMEGRGGNNPQKQLPPPEKKTDVGKLSVDPAQMLKWFEEARKEKEKQGGAPKKPNDNNAPRSQWQKEREAKRKAYEYIDFLLERYSNLQAWRAVYADDAEKLAEIDLEIEIVRAEFEEKTGEKVIQDGKFS